MGQVVMGVGGVGMLDGTADGTGVAVFEAGGEARRLAEDPGGLGGLVFALEVF